MKIALIALAVVVALLVCAGVVMYLIGRGEPERHTARIRFSVAKPREAVWAALTDYAAMPQWWPAVKAVRFETRGDGTVLTWNKDSHGREIAFRTAAETRPSRLVREIVGEDLPFGGTWTYELSSDGAGTAITLTEDGFIRPPLMRAFAKFFMKPDATMKDFATHFSAYVAK